MNVKKKGNSFERLISKKLSMWWTDEERDDYFYRTHSSGARFTSREKLNKSTVNQEGDICSTHTDSALFSEKIIVECKHYKNIDITSLFGGESRGQNVRNWWIKLNDICTKMDKYPFLITRENRKKDLIFISHEFYKLMKFDALYLFYSPKYNLICFEFDEFLSNTNTAYFRENLRNI